MHVCNHTEMGNSQGLRIPKALLDALGLRENDRVELIQANDGIHIKKAAAAIIAFAILIGGITLAIYLKQVADYKRSVSETSIEEICLSDIPNGVYIGECDVILTTNKNI